jgi:DNA mismatch endonuclease, patch repair protein
MASDRLISPTASSAAARNVMRGNRATDTRPELALRSAVHRRGLRFRKHAAPIKGLRCRADLVFRRERIAVFLDGCLWHRCPDHGTMPKTNSGYWAAKLERNVARDRRNDALLREAGWTVLRIWEHEDPGDAADRVATAVAAQRAATPAR